MKFVVVNGRTPRTRSFCALCCESIGESYLRDIAAQLVYCSHKCYVGHSKVPVLALEYQARGSWDPPPPTFRNISRKWVSSPKRRDCESSGWPVLKFSVHTGCIC
jgi:hypothetical protein